MLKIGITGGIGSGKSLVSKAFGLLQIPTFNADNRAKSLIAKNSLVRNQIINLLGSEAYLEDGTYNRTFVAEMVFNNPELLKQLNGIVHPAVQDDAKRWFQENEKAPYVIYEAAIMNKAHDGNSLDYVLVVDADKQARIDRILKRDIHREVADVERIMANQKSGEEFREIADFVIYNNDDNLVLNQVLNLHQKLLTL